MDSLSLKLRKLGLVHGTIEEGNRSPNLTICTDACKGLENAVKDVFPRSEQRECFRHLMQKFVKKFRGDIFANMYPAARAYRQEVFKHHMDRILTACPEVGDYLQNHHNQHWMRCYLCKHINCDYVNNNLAESFNSWIKDVKDLPAHQLADKIREMIMELFFKRRRIGERLEGTILPVVINQLKMRTRGLAHMKANIEDYVHNYYLVERFRAAYQGVIEPMTDIGQWPKIDPGFKLLPSIEKRSAGRLRKTRIRNCLEKNPAPKRQCRCDRYGELGHRTADCPLNGLHKRYKHFHNCLLLLPASIFFDI